MSSELWEVLVPCVSNEGKPFRTRHHREWDRQVRAISGGLTIYKPASGQWISPAGELYRERMIPVRIACNEKQALKIARIVIKHYNQLACMIYRVSEHAIIVSRDEPA